jgi:SAM-dependent methyltransferase
MIYRKTLHSTAGMSQWYDAKYKEMGGCWQTPVEELDRHISDFGGVAGLSVLDVGCGDGSFVRRLTEHGAIACGVEISDEAIKRSINPKRLIRHDICAGVVAVLDDSTPRMSLPFDRIISLGSLEHVIDIDAALDNIRLSLAPEGRFYFLIPNELWKHNDQPNERTATDAEWTSLFKKHGLIVESAKRWNDSTAFQGGIYRALTCEIASVLCGGTGPKLTFNFHGLADDFSVDTKTERVCFIDPSIGSGMGNIKCRWYDNRTNLVTPCAAYQALLDATEADVLVYVHDDVDIYDPNWLTRVMNIFETNPKCVAVGLGGATSLGRPSLYKRRYRIEDMARGGYASNQRDWNIHGELLVDNHRVAVLDAFFMAVRADFILSIGGWPVDHLSHHCLDLWLACQAARHEKEVWVAGIECAHFGGGSSTKPTYRSADWLQGGCMEEDHRRPHRYLHQEFIDCLPITVAP